MSTDPRIEAAADAVGDYNSSDAWPKSAMSQALAALAAFNKAATITTVEELDALPVGAAIVDAMGTVLTRSHGCFHSPGHSQPTSLAEVTLPARVIHWGTE